MTTATHTRHVLTLLITMLLMAWAGVAHADHEAMVAGEVVSLSNASLGHGENCDDVHWHGDLNGKPDPNPDGCGHGVVTILPHNEDGESIIEVVVVAETEERSGAWEKFKGLVGDIIDVAAQALGLPAPKTIYETTEIVEDAAPSIKENIDTIDEYRDSVPEDEDTLGIYDDPAEGLEEGSLSQRFFSWLNSLTE